MPPPSASRSPAMVRKAPGTRQGGPRAPACDRVALLPLTCGWGSAMRGLAVMVFLLMALPAAVQEWSVGPVPGSANGAPVASITNADGHLLILRGETVKDGY